MNPLKRVSSKTVTTAHSTIVDQFQLTHTTRAHGFVSRAGFDSEKGRRFLCAYKLPIRDLCATAFLRFIVLCFLREKKCGISPPTSCLRCATDGSA